MSLWRILEIYHLKSPVSRTTFNLSFILKLIYPTHDSAIHSFKLSYLKQNEIPNVCAGDKWNNSVNVPLVLLRCADPGAFPYPILCHFLFCVPPRLDSILYPIPCHFRFCVPPRLDSVLYPILCHFRFCVPPRLDSCNDLKQQFDFAL